MADKKDALTVEELGLIEAEAAMWSQPGDRCDGNDPCDYDNVCRQHKVTRASRIAEYGRIAVVEESPDA